MDVSLGKVPDVTADLIRKAFYPADEHVADAAAADGFSAAGTGGTWPAVDPPTLKDH